LGECLDCDWFKIGIAMVEGFYSSVFNEGSGVGDDSTGGAADVGINLEDFLEGFRNNQGGIKSAFDCKDNTLGGLDSNGGGTELNKRVCTLMASMAYSTWKIRPSGEKVLIPRS
jgi:hypothetical protein